MVSDSTIKEERRKDVDLSGLKCPLPVLRLRKILHRAAVGDLFRVTCTDPLTAIDIPHLLQEIGDVLEEQQDQGGKLVFLIRVAREEKGPAERRA